MIAWSLPWLKNHFCFNDGRKIGLGTSQKKSWVSLTADGHGLLRATPPDGHGKFNGPLKVGANSGVSISI